MNINMVALLLETASVFAFCGFLILLVIPRLLTQAFYTLPRFFYYAIQGHVRWQSVFFTLGQILLWAGLIAGLYAAAYFLNFSSFLLLTASLPAKLCLIIGFVSMLWHMAREKHKIRDRFFQESYLENATKERRERYLHFIRQVEGMHKEEAERHLDDDLPYLERKALQAHIALLKRT